MGIKSFIGKRFKSKKDKPENITVSDYMTKKLIVFKPQQSVLLVMNQLIKNRISGGPVVNENNELVGKMIVFNTLSLNFRKIKLTRNADCVSACSKR